MYLANILRIVMNQFTVSLRLCFFFFSQRKKLRIIECHDSQKLPKADFLLVE